jgi:hypothetical protein
VITPVRQLRFMAERETVVLFSCGDDESDWVDRLQRRSFSSRESAARWIAKGALLKRRVETQCNWPERGECECRYCQDDYAARLIARFARLILRKNGGAAAAARQEQRAVASKRWAATAEELPF